MRAPIGIDDFKKMIERNSTFIDKTLLIDEILNSSTDVILFTRPRRFGKSLNLSMMYYFFSNKENSNNLFKNLKINNKDSYKELNKYPVIHISFKDAKGDINNIISFIYKKLDECFNENVDQYLLNKYNKYKDELSKYKDFNLNISSDSLKFLTEVLFKIYNKKVILLIDEYDAPIINAISSNCYDKLRYFISSLYSSALKDNIYLERAVLTGIQRVLKNILELNIEVNSVSNKYLNEYFGFTTEETKFYLNEFNLDLTNKVKYYYNGYIFSNVKIYNPWSIVNYAKNKELIPYWANTGNTFLLKEYLLKSSNNFKQQFQELLLNNEVIVIIDVSLSVFETKLEDKYLWGLFLNSGYITIKQEIDSFNGVYNIIIPNREVKKEINDLFIKLLNVEETPDLFTYLINKEYSKFITKYKDYILNNTSFHDHCKIYENSYHMFTLGMLLMKLYNYEISSNLETGLGRVDILCESRSNKPHLIFEFKVGNNPKEAINQIHKNKYYSNLKGDILLIGISYDNKKCYINIEEITIK